MKRHPYKEVLKKCILCGKEGSIEKILDKPINYSKKNDSTYQKPGVLTQQTIEEIKHEIKKEKKALRKRKK
jgi:hypothetical protein